MGCVTGAVGVPESVAVAGSKTRPGGTAVEDQTYGPVPVPATTLKVAVNGIPTVAGGRVVGLIVATVRFPPFPCLSDVELGPSFKTSSEFTGYYSFLELSLVN
jgi:hypothetical protein